MLRPCLDSLSLLINDFYHISGRFDRNSEEQEEGKKISVGVSVEILHSRNRCYYLNDEEKCCKIVGRGIKVHGSRVYRVFRSRRDFLRGPRRRTRNILFFFKFIDDTCNISRDFILSERFTRCQVGQSF